MSKQLRIERRPVHGVLVLDKPLGLSSNQALQKAKYLLKAKKAGHTGALDPLASGVLPLCFGEATKFSQYLLDSDKTYLATFQLGLETESGDLDAPIVKECSADHIVEEQVRAAIELFTGNIEQVPPMYSALKHQGQPLYKLARNGVQIERKPRSVTVYDYKLHDFRAGEKAEIDVEIACSKGTYIRSLAIDLGVKLSVGATVTALRRTQAGPYQLTQAMSLEELSARLDADNEAFSEFLMPMDSPVGDLPSVILPESTEQDFSHGQAVFDTDFCRLEASESVRVFTHQGQFLGLGAVTNDGRIQPKRLVVV
jgi:tRNA pseudouridine55 synthase